MNEVPGALGTEPVARYEANYSSRSGNSVTVVALPLIAAEVLDADSTAVGLLAAAVWLPWLLVGLPGRTGRPAPPGRSSLRPPSPLGTVPS
ncbi:hypothetical protein ACFV2U_44675 [Streptomyces sp. NPDC059697]|uniref:hypothetical protein n=1 Tax=Streptomyces sp. NPDC059697 TaxID=3346912 RepID=UPI0036A7B765